MIKEIFITDSTQKIIFGNTKLYPKNPVYPIHVLSDERLAQLKVNDVVLSALYNNFDNFTVAKFLLDLKLHLESKLISLDSATVKENYFLISELAQNINSMIIRPCPENKKIIPSDNVYIDVVESIHTVISEDMKVLNNFLLGQIITSNGKIENFKAILSKPKKYDIVSSSNYLLKDHLNKIEVEAKNFKQDPIILSYRVNLDRPIIEMKRVKRDEYTFYTGTQLKFKSLKISIPVPSTTFAAEIKSTAGSYSLDIKKNIVTWEFYDFDFKSESITVDPKLFEEEICSNSIMVEFVIQGRTESGVEIETCGADGCKFWVHYSIQAGNYEIRQ